MCLPAPIIFEKDYFIPIKMTSRLFSLEYVWNILFYILWIFLEIKKIMFQKEYFEIVFSLLNFLLRKYTLLMESYSEITQIYEG